MKQFDGSLVGGVECLDGFPYGLRGDLAAFGLKIGGGIGGKDGQARLPGADDQVLAIFLLEIANLALQDRGQRVVDVLGRLLFLRLTTAPESRTSTARS